MIRQGQAKRALSRTGLLAVGATALAALSVGPALGQSAETVPAPEKLGTSAAPVSPTPSASIESDDATVASLKELDRAKMQVDHLQRQLADLQRKLDIATARLKVLEQGGSMGAGLESGTGRGGVSSGRPGAAYGITSRFAPPGVYPGANSTMPVPSGGIAAFDPNQPGNVSANSRSGTMTFAPNRAAGNSFRKPDRQADRLDAMQKQLQQMMQDLQKMRDEQADRPGASADAAPEAPAKR